MLLSSPFVLLGALATDREAQAVPLWGRWGRSFTATAGAAKLFAHEPAAVTHRIVPVMLGPGGAQSSWRVEVDATGPAAWVWFLHVLEVAPLMQNRPTLVDYSVHDEKHEVVSFGPHTVTIDYTATGPTMMTLGAAPPPPPDPQDMLEKAREELHAAVDAAIDRVIGGGRPQ